MSKRVRLTAVAAIFGAYCASANVVDFSTYSAGSISTVSGYDLVVIDGSGTASASIVDDGSGVNVLRLSSGGHGSAVAMLGSKQIFNLADEWSVSADFSINSVSGNGPLSFGIYNAAVVDADGLASGEASIASGDAATSRMAMQMTVRPTGAYSFSYVDAGGTRREPGSAYSGSVNGSTRYTVTFECDGVNLVATLSDSSGTELKTLSQSVTALGPNVSGDALKFAFGDTMNNSTSGYDIDVYKITTIPEPATISLFIIASCVGLAGRKWIQK
ncbi:MAG: hypothetical protein WC959_06735 [Kiritimatiellales bacterium]